MQDMQCTVWAISALDIHPLECFVTLCDILAGSSRFLLEGRD